MEVSAVNTVSMKGNQELPEVQKQPQVAKIEVQPDTVNFSGKEASTGKKWFVGISSIFFPGVGQAINGEWGKGAAFLLVGSALKNMAAKGVGGIATAIAALGVAVWSCIDAVKGTKADK